MLRVIVMNYGRDWTEFAIDFTWKFVFYVLWSPYLSYIRVYVSDNKFYFREKEMIRKDSGKEERGMRVYA